MIVESDERSKPEKRDLIAQEPKTGRILVFAGLAGTILYAVMLFCYLGKWDSLFELEPEKFGSFLSGAVGPLALFWLVLGFFQQGSELKHSARALWLQSEELRNSVEQQKALVAVAREQIEHERSEREHAQREVERLAQPIFGIQFNGGQSAGDAREFDFLVANAGATCTNVRLIEGDRSFGDAATLAAGAGATVKFRFEKGETIRERSLTIKYTDGLGIEKEQIFVFPVIERHGELVLYTSRKFDS